MAGQLLLHELAAALPGGEHGEGGERDEEREPAALGILIALAEKKARSTRNSEPATRQTTSGCQRHIMPMTKAIRMVSIIMVPVTAMP